MAENVREEEQARVCNCGHSAFWHGVGGCEQAADCDCKHFELDHIDTIAGLRGRIERLLKPPEDGPRRYVVMLCDGCEDCEPTDGAEKSRFPCRNSDSSRTGTNVVLAEDYDTMARINREREAALRRLTDHGRLQPS